MEEFKPVNPYVSARYEYAKKQLAEVDELIKELSTADNEEGRPAKITHTQALTLKGGFQTLKELAYGLDAALKALNIYADASFWKEVPEHTYAANDLGMKARVALATVDPV